MVHGVRPPEAVGIVLESTVALALPGGSGNTTSGAGAERMGRARVVLLALFAISVALFPLVRTVKVIGNSMAPTFQNGQIVVALKPFDRIAPLQAGDIVIARPTRGEEEGDEVIKRVLFIQNAEGSTPFPKWVEINGKRVGTLPLFPLECLGRRVPEPGDIYLLGDNWMDSSDSREYGAIRRSDILGKVIAF